MTYFPFAQYWWFYLSFISFVLVVLSIDLGVFNKKAHTPSFKEASLWTVVWFSLAMIFCAVFYYYCVHKFTLDPVTGFAPQELAQLLSLQFLTGYMVELFLSVDNIFIFIVIFNYFAIQEKYQHRILFYGILGALIFRGIFIALGSALMSIKFVVLFFGALLVYTGAKMMWPSNHEKELKPEQNFFIKFLKKLMPVYPKIDNDRFFVKIKHQWHMTPLFIALVFLELTDIVFAIDSVPAIFAVTKESMVVFTSNIFAILGLRSLYFMLIGVIGKFKYLKYGLGFVLVFVGNKMLWLNDAYGGHFPAGYSLLIITGAIGLSILATFFVKKR